jgi:hypothetical protein
MRVVAACALARQGLASVHPHTPAESLLVMCVLLAVSAATLVGVWTPITGALGVMVEIGIAFEHAGDVWIPVLVATLLAALALIGPGASSVDAHLFGWRRIEIQSRKQ